MTWKIEDYRRNDRDVGVSSGTERMEEEMC